MTEFQRRFQDDMTLHGLAPTTQKVYLYAVERLTGYYRRSPDQLTEQELREELRDTEGSRQVVRHARTQPVSPA